jgi:hypothetical protein
LLRFKSGLQMKHMTFVLFFILAMAFASPAFAVTPTLVQQITGTWSSGSSYTATLPSAPASGHLLILTYVDAAQTVAGISSIAQTNVTWSKAVSSKVNEDVEIWYGVVGSAAGTVATINLSGTPTTASLSNISEWSGLLTSSEVLANGTSANNGSGLTPTTATITPTAGKNVLIVAASRHGSSFTSGPTSGFTSLSAGTAGLGYAFAYLIVSSTSGSYSTSWTYGTSGAWDAEIATFLAARTRHQSTQD